MNSPATSIGRSLGSECPRTKDSGCCRYSSCIQERSPSDQCRELNWHVGVLTENSSFFIAWFDARGTKGISLRLRWTQSTASIDNCASQLVEARPSHWKVRFSSIHTAHELDAWSIASRLVKTLTLSFGSAILCAWVPVQSMSLSTVNSLISKSPGERVLLNKTLCWSKWWQPKLQRRHLPRKKDTIYHPSRPTACIWKTTGWTIPSHSTMPVPVVWIHSCWETLAKSTWMLAKHWVPASWAKDSTLWWRRVKSRASVSIVVVIT